MASMGNTTEEFPNPCNNCGLCCMMQVCPVGKVMGLPTDVQPCPELRWDASGEKSSCGLVDDGVVPPEIIGAGKGCCISAKVVAHGKPYDFASLPDTQKTMAAQQLKWSLAQIGD